MASDNDAGVYTHLRQLISTVDDLKDVGLNQYIQLPRICVVGTQSAGKSSLLEAVVGIDFLPRGDGVVTRRPLEMRLVHINTGTESGNYAVFDGDSKKYSCFTEVKQEIVKRTDDVAGLKKGIVDDPIKIAIYGQEVPDLTLVDLPGITRVPLRDSDQGDDIEKVTKEMVMRYATDPRTVILAVIPANQDISTSDALQIARSVDPKGIRTLGVITKIDIMDSGTDAVNMLKGNDIPLRLGYIGVKLRSKQDINTGVTISQSVIEETQFFQRHPAYRTLSPSFWGAKNLTSKLAQVLFRHIKHCLPDIKAEISYRKNSVMTRLGQLGTGPPVDDTERIQLIWSLVTDFCEILKNTIRGKFDRRLSSYFNDSENLSGGAEIRQIFNQLLEDQLRSDMTSDMTDYDIDRAIRQHEGDSLPGFPSPDTFEYLLLPHLKEISQPVIDCLDRVSTTLEVMANHIISKIFQRFPALGAKVTVLSEEILHAQKKITKDILDNVIAAETGYVFTNDESYLVNHASMGKMMPTTMSSERVDYNPSQGHMDHHPQSGVAGQPGQPGNNYSIKSLQAMTSNLIQSGSNIVAGVPRTMTGMMDGDRKPVYSHDFIQEIRTRLNSYHKLVLRNTRETVPKTIGHFLVRSLQDILQYQLYQTLTKAENLDELLGEPSEIRQERAELKEQRSILESASTVLQKDLGCGVGSTASYLGFDEFFDRDIAKAINPPTPANNVTSQVNGATSQNMAQASAAMNSAQAQHNWSEPMPTQMIAPNNSLPSQQARSVTQQPSMPKPPASTKSRKGLFM